MLTELERQAIVDEEHLRFLPVSYWVLGAMDAFVSLYGLIYVAMGLVFALIPLGAVSSADSADPALAIVGSIFIAIGAVFVVGFGSVAVLQILTGFWIRKRKHRVMCLVMAGVTCVYVPFGTLIGVLTFMTLLRPSVAALFDSAPGGSGPEVESATPTDQLPVT